MKTPFIDFTLYSNVLQSARTHEDGTTDVDAKRKITLTYSRTTTIPPEFVGHTVGVHNGKKFNNLHILKI